MKKLNKIIAVILCCVAIIFSSAVFAHAEGVAVSVAISAPSSVKVNSEFTVTIKFTSTVNMGSIQSTLKYNKDSVTFISGDDIQGSDGKLELVRWIGEGAKTSTVSVKFKAKAAGSSTFALSGTEVTDYDFGKMNPNNPSATTKITANTPLSTNNYLSGIKLSSGTLSPKFAKKTLSYTVNVPNETSTMRVTATCEDSKAKANVTGSGSLKVGTNTIKITVTSESGAKRTYTVKVVRAAAEGESLPPASSEVPSNPPEESQAPSTNIYIDGVEYTVNENYEAVAVPEGFSQAVCTVNGTDVMALENKTGAITLLYLTDSEQSSSFFVYDKSEISYIPYRTLTVGDNTYVALTKPRGLSIPAGFSPADLTVGDQSYSAWVADDNSDYYMLYLCNINGKPTLYIYDAAEGTVQRRQSFESAEVDAPLANTPSENEKSSIWFYICIGLAAAVVGLTVAVIILAVKKSKRSDNTANSEKLEFTEAELAIIKPAEVSAPSESSQGEQVEATSAKNAIAAPSGSDASSSTPDDASPFGDDFIIR